LFLLLLLVWLRLLRRPARAPAADLSPPDGFDHGLRPMVRDPVCGVYVARAAALTTVQGGEALFFCSPGCYRSFLGRAGSGRGA
jgi:YHS domain-containing protein